jgi:hypothetical protein
MSFCVFEKGMLEDFLGLLEIWILLDDGAGF